MSHVSGEERPSISALLDQADRFRRAPASRPAVKHSIRHAVVSQVISPEVADFLPADCVVARAHKDELCCVDAVTLLGPISAAGIEYLVQFPYLVELDFGRNATDAARLALVAEKLPQLQHLTLFGSDGVDAAGIAEVAKLTQLRYLDLSECDVDAAGLAEVAKLTHLRHLHLCKCDGVDAAGLAEVAKCSELQHLTLILCNSVDTAGLAEVGKLSQLQHLNLSLCGGVNAAGLAELVRLTQLEHLELFLCNVDGAEIADFSKLSQSKTLTLLSL